MASVEAATEEIVRHPQFPYGLIYAVQGDTIYVAAVMHLKRKPGYWVPRTKRSPS